MPREAGATETRNVITIRFLEREGNESEISNPLQEYVGEVRELQVDYGDPASLVAQQVNRFLNIGKRTCDRYKKFIPAEECYSVATREENKNTLFLLPDVESQGEVVGQGNQAPEGGGQAMDGLRDHEVPQAVVQAPEGEYQTMEGLEDDGAPQQEEEQEVLEDWGIEVLLDPEQENAANSHILDRDTTVIYVKKRVGDSHDISQPAKHWEWRDVTTLEVPINDPQRIVERRMRMFWEQRKWKPYNSNLRTLAFEDCYREAMNDEDHTLYMMPSLQTEEKATEQTIPWFPPPPIAPAAFRWHEEPNRRRINASLQTQEETGLEGSTFVPPPNICQLPPQQEEVARSAAEVHWKNPLPHPPKHQPPLVKSTTEVHRDKIGRGRENKIEMSFQEESIGIRKRPGDMRIMQPPMADQPKASIQHRKITKPRNRNREMAEDEIY